MPQPKQAQQDEQHERGPVFAAYGDSFVAGWGVAESDSLPVRLEQAFARLGKPWRVLNFGVSGETALEGLERLPEVLEARPGAALVDFGGNDCYQGRPLEETHEALSRIISGLLAENVGVFLAGWRTSLDLFKPSDDPELAGLLPLAPPLFTAEYVERFNKMHGALARHFNVPYIEHILTPLDGIPGCFQADGVHPNAKGARLLADALAPLILPLLK
jgi:acyl-CoA thioesterase-1